MHTTCASLSMAICCLLWTGCGQSDDGNSLSGTSLTTASLTLTTVSDNGEEDETDSGSCPDGAAGCPCYGNGTCDDGLSCSDGVCTPPGGDGDGDSGDGDGDSGDGDGDSGDGDGDSGDGDGDSGDGDGDGDGEVYSAVGPQTNVPVADVVGWEVCYMAPYSDGTTPVATMLSNCDGDHLMLACKQSNANTYTVLAHAPRADVLMEQDLPYTPHVANGSGWYYDFSDTIDHGGFGFAQAGDALDAQPCDLAVNPNSDRRLCWHISQSAMAVGFRCGANLWLFEGVEWQRVLLQRND